MFGTSLLPDFFGLPGSFVPNIYLVGGFNPFEKILVKMDHFPK